MPVEKIRAIDDPRVADFRVTRDAQLLKSRGLFIAESPFVVKTLIERTDFQVASVLCAEHRLEVLSDVLSKLPERVPVYVADRALINEIPRVKIHRSCLALAHRPQPKDAGALLDSLAARSTVIVLEAVSNPDNVGSIFRNAAALGVDALLLDPESQDPLYRKTIRVSIASSLTVPYAWVESSKSALELLSARGFERWALTPSSGAQEIESSLASAPPKLALFLGKEGPGLNASTIEKADRAVRISMTPGPDALNVASASAIAMYLVRRR